MNLRNVIDDLQKVMELGGLTSAASLQADQLLHRLRAGVHVVVLGPQGIGKTQLCSVLLGELLPHGGANPCRVYRHSENAKSAQRAGDIAISHPLLENITLTDVNTSAGGDLGANLRKAMDQADVVLWCTQEFSADEMRLWSQASEHLKDHSFLVLTKADQFAVSGELPNRVNALQGISAEEFHSFFPTSTLQAFQSLQKTGEIPYSQMAASGVAALSETLRNLAASGQRTDLDNALLFLKRRGMASVLQVEKIETPRLEYASYEKALALLRSRTPALIAAGTEPETLEADLFLNCCSALAEDLSALAAKEQHNAPDFDAWRDDLFEASDKVVLMSLEGDLRSAADAATVILQLTQDLEDRLV